MKRLPQHSRTKPRALSAASSALCLAALLAAASPARRQEPARTPAQPEPAASSSQEPRAPEPTAEADADNVGRPREVNLRPFQDLLAKAEGMLRAGKLEQRAPLELSVEADILDDGTLENVVYGGVPSDDDAFELAKEFMVALSQSGALMSARRDVSHIRLTLEVGENVSAVFTGEALTEARARHLEQGYGMMLKLARLSKKGTDAGTVYEALKIGAEGKQFTVWFQMPRAVVAKMLSRKLTRK